MSEQDTSVAKTLVTLYKQMGLGTGVVEYLGCSIQRPCGFMHGFATVMLGILMHR